MVNLIYGNNCYDCDRAILERLKENRLDEGANHILLVPDKFSVSMEKMVFNHLDIESFCDIEVYTLTRLANETIKKQNVLDKTSAVMLIQKIILNNFDKFACFSKAVKDTKFATTIYETINQLKSCKISFEDLKNDGSDILSLKLKDIATIYEEYEKCLTNGTIDANDRLDLLFEEIKNSDHIKNSHIYITHFDNLTRQGYLVLEEMFKYCKSVTVSCVQSENLINGHIYLNDVKENVLRICRKLNIEPQIIQSQNELKGVFKFIGDNLFSYKTRSINAPSDVVSVWEGEDFADEVKMCAINIRKEIISKNLRYKDFAVAVNGLEESKAIIEKIFNEYGISYFIDTSYEFSKTILVKFINDCFNLYLNGFTTRKVLSIIKNPILNYDNDLVFDFEDYVLKYKVLNLSYLKTINFSSKNTNYENFNVIREDFIKKIKPFFDALKNSKTVKDYIGSIDILLNNFAVFESINLLQEKLLKEGDLKTARILSQLEGKFKKVISSIEGILSDTEFDANEFFDVLSSGVDAVKISLTPLQLDGVFVGDSLASFYNPVKVLFVLGCCEGSFPKQNQDVGVISDKEIKVLENSYKIEPTIATINLRQRFTIFSLLLLPKERLYLSYSLKTLSGAIATKSNVVNQLQKMFLVKDRNGKSQDLPTYKIDRNLNTFVENLSTKQNAKQYLINGLRYVYDGSKFCNLDEYIELFNYFKQNGEEVSVSNFKYDNSKRSIKTNLFFRKSTFGVSEVESFMLCPFIHYMNYGLRAKEKDLGELDQMNVGNIMHAVAEMFNKQNNLPIEDGMVEDVVLKIFDKALSEEAYEGIVNNISNKIQIDNLQKEAIRFCRAINEQSKHTEFKTILCEAFFDDKNKIKGIGITIGNKTIRLVGAVDRIDTFKDYFRIIDYKTGKCDISFAELYYGKKIQLYVYQNVVENSLKLKPAGAYYFPVKNSFNDEENTTNYKLKGYTVFDEEVIYATDDNLIAGQSSDIIYVKKNKPNKDGSVNFNYYSKLLKQSDLKNLGEYAVDILSKACKDILGGEISPSPLSLDGNIFCDKCKYRSICRYDDSLKNRPRVNNYKIDINTFKRGQDGEE